MVVVLDGVLDLGEGVLGVVHAKGEPVQQVRVRLQHGVQRGVAQREATVVVADARRLLKVVAWAEKWVTKSVSLDAKFCINLGENSFHTLALYPAAMQVCNM